MREKLISITAGAGVVKRAGKIFTWRGGFVLAAAILLCGLSAPNKCLAQEQEVVLLLEQIPVKGGETSPLAGVHHFKPGTEVVLSANPKPGYQFVHWLGDVSDATA
ncbi:MAG: InlB B-repeat-containing protein, partial [Planctomycetota bacterium]